MKVEDDIEGFVKLKPITYKFLKEIGFRRIVSTEGASNYEVHLVLSNPFESMLKSLCMKFNGVVDITIHHLEGMPGLFINMEDVRSEQQEGISYRVTEQENDAFSFSCRSFTAELIG